MEQYIFRPARETDLPRIGEIMRQAKMLMEREGRRQWDDTYPLPCHIEEDMRRGYAWVLSQDEIVMAYAAVIFDGEPVYAHIRGRWLSEGPFVVVHRLAVAEDCQGRGMATRMMREVEAMSQAKGIPSFRVDTHLENTRMRRVLEKCGFIYCGEVFYPRGSRMAYEKRLGKPVP